MISVSINFVFVSMSLFKGTSKKISLKNEKDYAESLEKSFKYFFNVIKKNQTFSKKETNISLKSNQLLF